MGFLENGNIKNKDIEETLRKVADNCANGELTDIKEELLKIVDAIDRADNIRNKLVMLLEDSPYLDALGAYEFYEKTADHLISHGVRLEEWYPVSKKPPREGKYLCCCDGSYIDVYSYKDNLEYADGFYDFEDDRFFECEDVTHWMPLPEPPNQK